MARNVKPGITFYRMDSGHIINKKIRLLYNEFGADGYYIWSSLIDYAYCYNGYYFDLRDKEQLELFASDYCKKKIATINEVIQGCIRRGLFSKAVADPFGILTSAMMQEVFLYATSERRKKGSIFEMQNDWLLLQFETVPVNIKIVPVNNGILPANNSQTRQDLNKDIDKTKQEILLSQNFKNFYPEEETGKRNAGPEFIPPVQSQVRDYLLWIIGNKERPYAWSGDKCFIEADKFLDYYTANGWMQGENKPIKDWQAACRNWIRKENSGAFYPDDRKKNSNYVQYKQEVTDKNILSKDAVDINYLFEMYLQNKCSITSIDAVHYDYLRQKLKVEFSEDIDTEIEQAAINYLTEKKVTIDNKLMLATKKKYCVLAIFNEYKRQHKNAIFKVQ
jgi:hypothetical protein